MHTHTNTNIHTKARAYTQTHPYTPHTYMRTCIQTCTHVHTHTYIHTHTHTSRHMHACNLPSYESKNITKKIIIKKTNKSEGCIGKQTCKETKQKITYEKQKFNCIYNKANGKEEKSKSFHTCIQSYYQKKAL